MLSGGPGVLSRPEIGSVMPASFIPPLAKTDRLAERRCDAREQPAVQRFDRAATAAQPHQRSQGAYNDLGRERMGYRLEWRLVGRANQPLDSGTIDGDFADRPSAFDAIDSLLLTFPLRGCNEAEGY